MAVFNLFVSACKGLIDMGCIASLAFPIACCIEFIKDPGFIVSAIVSMILTLFRSLKGPSFAGEKGRKFLIF